MKFFFPILPNQQKSGKNPKKFTRNLVPLAGLEPARTLVRGILSPLRLPIPPQRRIFFTEYSKAWLGRRVNVKFFVRNSQNFLKFSTHMLLSPLRLPIPPHERINMKFCSMNTSNNKKKTLRSLQAQSFLEAPPGFEPGDKGFADLCLTTWL